MLNAVLERLGVDRVILVGHSWGGLLALTFALDYPHRVAGLVVIAPPTHPWLGQTKWLYSVFAIPVFGWVFAHTLTLPFGALLIGPGFRGAFLPQMPPPGYMKRSAARLLLRPATLLANAADIAGLKAFLKRQAERYDTLAAPIVIITGDRDTWCRHGITRCGSPPRYQALEWRCCPASAICCTTPPPTGSSPRSRS